RDERRDEQNAKTRQEVSAIVHIRSYPVPLRPSPQCGCDAAIRGMSTTQKTMSRGIARCVSLIVRPPWNERSHRGRYSGSTVAHRPLGEGVGTQPISATPLALTAAQRPGSAAARSADRCIRGLDGGIVIDSLTRSRPRLLNHLISAKKKGRWNR